jgi:transposase-like protein
LCLQRCPPLSQNSCRLKFLKKIKFEIRDKTNIKYSEGFKEQALAKVYNRGNAQTIQDIADDLNISLQTLKTWMKKSKFDRTQALPLKSKRPQDWLPEERFTALQKSYSLLGEDLNA